MSDKLEKLRVEIAELRKEVKHLKDELESLSRAHVADTIARDADFNQMQVGPGDDGYGGMGISAGEGHP